MAKVKIVYYRTLELSEEVEVSSEEEADEIAKKRMDELKNSDFSDINEESYELSSSEIDVTIGIQYIL